MEFIAKKKTLHVNMGGHFYVVQIWKQKWRVIRNVCELAKTARKHQRKRKIIIHAGRQDEVCSVA